MDLNRDLLKNVLEKLGYEFEFDSNTPGIATENSIVTWDNIATIDSTHNKCIDESNIKTAKLVNLTLTNLNSKTSEYFENTTYKTAAYQDSSITSVTGRLIA